MKIRLFILTMIYMILMASQSFCQSAWRELLYNDADYSSVIEHYQNWRDTTAQDDSLLIKESKRFQRFKNFWRPRVAFNNQQKLVFSDWSASIMNVFNNQYCDSPDEASWISVGPFPGRQIMGYVSAIWMDPSDYDFVLAGTRMGGVWRTKYRGSTWECVTDQENLPILGVNSIAVSPNRPDGYRVIYASTGHYDTHGSIGIIKSEDNGDSWEVLELFPPYFHGETKYITENIRVAQNTPTGSPDIVLASVANTLYKSPDGGESWNICNNLIVDGRISDIEFFPNNSDNIVITTHSYITDEPTYHAAEIWFSNDGGNNWAEIGWTIPLTFLDGICDASVSIVNNTIYCYLINNNIDQYPRRSIVFSSENNLSNKQCKFIRYICTSLIQAA